MPRILHYLAAVALMTLLSPGVARAAPVAPRFTSTFEQVTLVPGAEPIEAAAWGNLAVREVPARTHRLTFDVDFSAVADFATVRFTGWPIFVVIIAAAGEPAAGDSCTPSGVVFHCVRQAVEPAGGLVFGLGEWSVGAKATAAPGSSGQVRIRVRMDSGPVTTSTSTLTVGTGVSLNAGGSVDRSLAPGHVSTFDPRIRNTGSEPVAGVVLALALEADLRVPSSFTNCVYDTSSVVCSFDTVLKPNRSYRLAEPVGVRLPPDVAAGSRAERYSQWLTPATWSDWQATFDAGSGTRPGTGKRLDLVPVVAAAAVPQVDTDPDDNTSNLTLTATGPRRPDVAAVGAELTVAGGRSKLRLGLTNRGPGPLRPRLFSNNSFGVYLTFPAGTEVERADPRCTGFLPREYLCRPSPTTLPARASMLFSFTVRGAGRHAGSVRLIPDEPGLETRAGRANNSAEIVLREGSGLPITGPGGALAVGLALLVAGALATRVRR